MFKIEEFRDFVESQIVWLGNTKRSLNKEQILDAVCQFERPIYILLGVSQPTASLTFKRVFNVTNKPVSLSYNLWFLYLFGYKKCYGCDKILPIAQFSIYNSRWDKLEVRCKDCASKKYKKYCEHNKEKIKKQRKQCYQNNIEKVLQQAKRYKQSNRNKYNAYEAKRRTAKLNATLKGLSKTLQIKFDKQILMFYTEAQKLTIETGIAYEVDHIIPLQGNNVSGLHVPWNLQVITRKENLNKGNKYNIE